MCKCVVGEPVCCDLVIGGHYSSQHARQRLLSRAGYAESVVADGTPCFWAQDPDDFLPKVTSVEYDERESFHGVLVA